MLFKNTLGSIYTEEGRELLLDQVPRDKVDVSMSAVGCMLAVLSCKVLNPSQDIDHSLAASVATMR